MKKTPSRELARDNAGESTSHSADSALRAPAPGHIASEMNLELLASMFYHDLQAPLRAAGGFLSLLEDEIHQDLSTDARHCLDRSRQALAHAQELAHRFMEFAHLGNLQIARQPLDLSSLARLIVDCLQASDPNRRVEVSIQNDLRVASDPLLTQQLLQNLIGNAWKFSSKSPRARIRIGAAANEEHVFEVSDNGCGFSAEQAKKLFVPFQRLHSSRDYAGYGIGLATAHRIVELHGGRIWATASAGGGATFCFTLSESAAARFTST